MKKELEIADLKAMREQYEKMKSKKDDMINALRVKEKKGEGILDNVSSEEIFHLEKLNESLVSQKSFLQKDLRDLEDTVQRLNTNLSKANSCNDKLKNDVKLLNEVVTKNEVKIKQFEDTFDKGKRSLSDLILQKSSLESKLKGLKTSFKKKAKQIALLKRENRNLKHTSSIPEKRQSLQHMFTQVPFTKIEELQQNIFSLASDMEALYKLKNPSTTDISSFLCDIREQQKRTRKSCERRH